MLAEFFQLGLGQLLVALEHNLTRGFVDDVGRRNLAHKLRNLSGQALDIRVLQLLDRELGELAVLLDEDFARVRVAHIARRPLSREQIVLDGLCVFLSRLEKYGFRVVVVVQQVLGRIAEGAQKHGRVQLASAIDADVNKILGVELEIQPRATVGDHARAVEQLARAVRLALVVIVEHAGTAV